MKINGRRQSLFVAIMIMLVFCLFVNTVNCSPQGNNTKRQQEQAIMAKSVDDERGFAFLKKKTSRSK